MRARSWDLARGTTRLARDHVASAERQDPAIHQPARRSLCDDRGGPRQSGMSNHPSRSVVRRSSADTYAEPDARREPNILFVKKGLFVRRPRAATAQTTIWNLRSQSR